MNVMENMEAIFLVAAFLTGITSVASAASENARERYDAPLSIQGKRMAVVKVSAKRLSAAEKARVEGMRLKETKKKPAVEAGLNPILF